MYTTIKVSDALKHRLDAMKLQESESYAEIIEDLIEDRLSLNPGFLREIEKRRKECKRGLTIGLEELKKETGV
jgi:predicted transcriptional regulator